MIIITIIIIKKELSICFNAMAFVGATTGNTNSVFNGIMIKSFLFFQQVPSVLCQNYFNT